VLTVCLFVFDLETIIGEMSVFVINVVHIKVCTTCSNVSGVIEVEIKIALSKCPDTNVEFSTFVKKWFLDILLNNPVGKLNASF